MASKWALALALGLLAACRLPGAGPVLLTAAVVLVVPALGVAAAALLMLVGPVAAPAVWDGLGTRAVLGLLMRQLRHHFVRTLLLSAAVSLLTATLAGLVSAVVLAGRPAMLALAVTVFPLNTHLASYSTFWGGVLLMLSALYAGSLLGREQD